MSGKFNRPEETRKGLWRNDTMTASGQTRLSETKAHPVHRGEAAEGGRADHREAQP